MSPSTVGSGNCASLRRFRRGQRGGAELSCCPALNAGRSKESRLSPALPSSPSARGLSSILQLVKNMLTAERELWRAGARGGGFRGERRCSRRRSPGCARSAKEKAVSTRYSRQRFTAGGVSFSAKAISKTLERQKEILAL